MNTSLPTKIKTVAKKNPDPRNRGKGRLRGPGLRAVQLFTAQAFSGVYKPVEDTLLEAGYTPQSARQITNVMIGIRAHVEPIVQEMEEHRKAVMANMRNKVGRASYGELVRSLDVTTRNIRLLTGKSTHNFALQAEHRHKIEALLRRQHMKYELAKELKEAGIPQTRETLVLERPHLTADTVVHQRIRGHHHARVGDLRCPHPRRTLSGLR